MSGVITYLNGDRLVNLTKLHDAVHAIADLEVRHELMHRLVGLETVVGFLQPDNKDVAR